MKNKIVQIFVVVLLILVPMSARAVSTDSSDDSVDPEPVKAPTIVPSKPAGNWIINSELSRPHKLYCTQKKLVDRIRCRLSMSADELAQENSIQFLPEECRVLSGSTKTACIDRYKQWQTCFEKPDTQERLACGQEVLKLQGLISDAWQACNDENAKTQKTCQTAVRNQTYSLTKFYIEDLAVRAKNTLNPGSDINPVVDLTNSLELLKQQFNKAKNSAARIQVVTRAKTLWKAFVKNGALVDEGDNMDNAAADLKLVN